MSKFRPIVASIAVLLLAITATVATVVFLQKRNEIIFKDKLRERLTDVAATSVLSLNVSEIEAAIFNSDTDILREIAVDMQKVRSVNDRIKYIYILLPTSNSSEMKFLIDADTFNPIDWDNNGQIDDIEVPPEPQELYDISDSPMLAEALKSPTADQDLTIDEWGTFLSGYAPIISSGKTLAVLGIDMEVSDYLDVIQSTLLPFVLFGILLILILVFQTAWLIRIWRQQVNLVKELDRQKDELLSIVSHQLATPVSSFKWYLEMLLDGDLGELSKEQKEHIKTMQGIGGNLSDLVSMILDVSRIQLGRMRVEKQELDLSIFFKEILEIIEPKAIQKNLSFKKKIPSKLPTNAMLDRRYTHMTIENLLSNAVKYTPEKGTVTFNVEIKNNRMLCVVKDTGMGIPKSEQDKIFGRMFRASNVRNTVDGNGFGLFVAKGAVEAQGGKIWFESTEGKGTSFFVDLPLFEQ